MALEFPNIDPVAISIGVLDIRWYSLAYLAGFLLGWRYAAYLCSLFSPAETGKEKGKKPPTPKDIEDFIPWVVLGVIIGGRLGYILFYNSGMYFSNPLDMLKIWEGGMSFHGGVLGVIITTIAFSHIKKLDLLKFSDAICAAAPIGLFFGRIANFINGELFGRAAANIPWAVKFPQGGYIPRHPSQIYEALTEGLLLFIILFIFSRLKFFRDHPGMIAGSFFFLYATARMSMEQFRQPDSQIGFLFHHITMGQLLSAPMLLLGFAIVVYSLRSVGRDT